MTASVSAPLVSVIVPARNCPDQLQECLKAVRASDYPALEILVIDDASTDRTPQVAEAMGVPCLSLPGQSGPALARNRGAEAATGEYLFFLDADVCVHADTISRAMAGFQAEAGVDALFGSYDLQPRHPTLISSYKNLYHHYIHQISSEKALTFWSGCGFIRRSVFLEMGGFDTSYSRPCIEDIELGARLCRAGRRIVLKKDVQATHLKRWTLWGMVKSDVFDRAIPWTRLLMRERSLPNDLNLRLSQRLCVVLAYLHFGTLLVGAWFVPAVLLLPVGALAGLVLLDVWSRRRIGGPIVPAVAVLASAASAAAIGYAFGLWVLLPLGLLLAIIALNWPLYCFFARQRHWLFAAYAVPLQVLYYLYSGAGLVLGILGAAWDGLRPGSRAKAANAAEVAR